MKLIIAIVKDTDNDPVSHALTSANLRVTYIASTGGFLRRGNTTLFIGLDDERVEEALGIIRSTIAPATNPEEKRAIIFVLKVDDFIHY